MAKAHQHKSQHYVPRSYLAAWCDPTADEKMEPYVWTFERGSQTGQRKAPANILEETDFYTLKGADGERDLSLEKHLSALEGQFIEIRRTKLDLEVPVTTEEGAQIAAFVVAMSFRTKAHRGRRQGQWGRVLATMRELAEERGPRGEVPEVRWSGSPDPNDPSVSHDDIAKLAENPIQYMMAIEIGTYLPVLGRMEFMIVRTDDEIGFITSDDPCVWIGETEYKAPPPLSELGEFGILMPLSPRQLLFLNPYQSCYGKLPQHVVDMLNGYVWRNSHEYYIVNRDETRDAWFRPSK